MELSDAKKAYYEAVRNLRPDDPVLKLIESDTDVSGETNFIQFRRSLYLKWQQQKQQQEVV